MPNHVKSPIAQAALNVNSPPSTHDALQVDTKGLGWLDKRRLKSELSSLQRETNSFKANEIARQQQATAALAADVIGSLARVEIGRVHTESLAAIGGAMYDTYKVVANEQQASRFAGSVANEQMCSENLDYVRNQLTQGSIEHDRAVALAMTARDLYAETEARIDGRFQALTQATDRHFDAAFAPITAKRGAI